MVVRTGTEDSGYQTEWSEDQILALLESPQARKVLVTGLLESLAQDERVKEVLAEIAVKAVDKANSELSELVDDSRER